MLDRKVGRPSLNKVMSWNMKNNRCCEDRNLNYTIRNCAYYPFINAKSAKILFQNNVL